MASPNVSPNDVIFQHDGHLSITECFRNRVFTKAVSLYWTKEMLRVQRSINSLQRAEAAGAKQVSLIKEQHKNCVCHHSPGDLMPSFSGTYMPFVRICVAAAQCW